MTEQILATIVSGAERVEQILDFLNCTSYAYQNSGSSGSSNGNSNSNSAIVAHAWIEEFTYHELKMIEMKVIR